MPKFYVGDIVEIKKGEDFENRWNVPVMSQYVGLTKKIAMVSERLYGDTLYRIENNSWSWSEKDFILKEKRCSSCGKLIAEDSDSKIIDNRRYCTDCARLYKLECPICGEIAYDRNIWTVGDIRVCKSCFDKSKYCPTCNERFFPSKGYEDKYGNVYCSENCYEKYRFYNEDVEDYGYKPNPVFYGNKNELHLGIELEIDTKGVNYADRDSLVYNLSKISNKHFCKYDGSLGEYGVEIVTQPCTLEYHMNDFNWDKITSMCREEGYYSDMVSTCGMHIHVDRSYFENDKDAAVKLTYLLSKYRDNFINFSRRRSGAISDWANIIEIDNIDSEKLETNYNFISGGRYHALNTTNRHTLEFRLWKGSLNLETIFATIQMTQVLCDIVKNEEDIENISWVDICNYGDYKELKSYLLRRNLIREEEFKTAEVA